MVVKVLGAIDIIIAIFMYLAYLNIMPESWMVLSAFYLLIKGIFFLMLSRDIVSGIDAVAGFVIFLNIYFYIPNIIYIIVALILLQKGIFSVIG